MRISTLLTFLCGVALSACSASTASSGDDALAAGDVGSDIGLAFDTAKADSAPGTDQVDVAAGTDAETLTDTAEPDVQSAPDVQSPEDIVDVPPVKDVVPPQDVQKQPDVQTQPDVQSQPDVAEAECPSGVKWLLGDIWGTDLMEPGLACIQCHTKKGPKFTIAGTVYPGFHTVDTCNGVASITVEITGADGKVQKITTNSVGNFKSTTAVALPYTARVIDSSGKERKMFDEQTDGDCNICHTATGANNAPGRIHAP